jgi:hypothetical protein
METEPQAMEVDQSSGQQQAPGTTEEQETELQVRTTEEQNMEPQAIEASEHETHISDVSPFSPSIYINMTLSFAGA